MAESNGKKNWLKKLVRSSTALVGNLNAAIGQRKVSAEVLAEIEESLILADLGHRMAAEIVAQLAKHRSEKSLDADAIRILAANHIAAKLSGHQARLDSAHLAAEARASGKPVVVMLVGANGSGKTTTIGKLASELAADGVKTMVAACDTFRAAAVEQLAEWCLRSGVACLRGDGNSDPAALAYRALETAEAEQYQVLLIDTAGRLHTKGELMAELSKMERVLQKRDPLAPHHIVMVLDATMGQTAIKQLEVFTLAVKVTSLIITKLDGTAKAGIAVALAEQFKIPIVAIGLGEAIADLQAFDADEFARALLGIGNEG
ncbi:MAG: signal recognition particle-docking protein FtsY [Candidatus Pacebacteria bacterium]|nr:signal recognition particle-docking protein FtsY [Candidatus Paceibacterota bacterium]